MANESLSHEEYLDSLLKKVSNNTVSEEGEKQERNLFEQDNQESDLISANSLEQGIHMLNEPQEEELADILKSTLGSIEGEEEIDTEEIKDWQKSMEYMQDSTSYAKEEESPEDLLSSLDSLVEEAKREQSVSLIPDNQQEPQETILTENLIQKEESVVLEQPILEAIQEVPIEDIDSIPEAKIETKEPTEDTNTTKKSKKKKSDKKENTNKVSFLEKLKNIFFKVEVVDAEEEEKLSENERVLKELEKEEKKKAKAAEKDKKKAEKQEAAKKRKENSEIKKQYKKQKKEEKIKNAPPKEPEERVHIKPVFWIFSGTVIFAVVLALLVGTNLYSYQNSINSAQKYFDIQKYDLAYNSLDGMTVKLKDRDLYDKIRITMRLEKQYNSFVNFMELNMRKEALDALIKGVDAYDGYISIGRELGIEENMNQLLDTISYSLENTFGLTLEEGRAINQITNSREYTLKIEAYCNAQ